jgi:hypothetical protein
MEAIVHCERFATKGASPFGRLLFSREVREAEDEPFVRQMKLLHHRFRVSFISVSSVVKFALVGAAPLRCAIFTPNC